MRQNMQIKIDLRAVSTLFNKQSLDPDSNKLKKTDKIREIRTSSKFEFLKITYFSVVMRVLRSG